jgi:hypothetical protein
MYKLELHLNLNWSRYIYIYENEGIIQAYVVSHYTRQSALNSKHITQYDGEFLHLDEYCYTALKSVKLSQIWPNLITWPTFIYIYTF